jgi:hypothetical protein
MWVHFIILCTILVIRSRTKRTAKDSSGFTRIRQVLPRFASIRERSQMLINLIKGCLIKKNNKKNDFIRFFLKWKK